MRPSTRGPVSLRGCAARPPSESNLPLPGAGKRPRGEPSPVTVCER